MVHHKRAAIVYAWGVPMEDVVHVFNEKLTAIRPKYGLDEMWELVGVKLDIIVEDLEDEVWLFPSKGIFPLERKICVKALYVDGFW